MFCKLIYWKCELTVFLFIILSYIAGCSDKKPVAPPGNYDLTVSRISHTPNPVKVGDKVVFSYSVRNSGKDAIPGRTYNVDFYIDGKLVSFDHATDILNSNSETHYSKSKGYWHFEAKEVGQHTYRVVLDEENSLPETDEINNVIGGTFQVYPKE